MPLSESRIYQVMREQNCSYSQACKWLAKRANAKRKANRMERENPSIWKQLEKLNHERTTQQIPQRLPVDP